MCVVGEGDCLSLSLTQARSNPVELQPHYVGRHLNRDISLSLSGCVCVCVCVFLGDVYELVSVRSALTPMLFSPPRWKPPIPPVTNTRILAISVMG